MTANPMGRAIGSAAAVLSAAGAWPAPAARADVVTIDRVAGADDVKFEREVIEDLSPLPGVNFFDSLHVAARVPVEVDGGDTVRFRVRLEEPLRFEVSP